MGIISNLLFGDNSNNTSYKDAAYKKRFQDISNATYDSMYGGMTDYLDKNYEGGSSKFKYDFLGGLKDDADKAIQGYKESRYNTFGNGLIGGLLNPIAQTASGIGDLTGLALSGGKVNAWDSGKDPLGVSRDVGSDLGALGETALTVIPMANSLRVAKAGKAVNAAKAAGKVIEPGTKLAKQAALWGKSQVPKTLGQKVAAGALGGAGLGAAGSLRDMGFENFDPNKFAMNTAISAGVGGGLSAGGELLGKYTSAKVPVKTGDATPYQEALNNLKSNYKGAPIYSDVATNLPATTGLDVSRITLDNLDGDTLKKLFRSGVKNARSSAVGQDTNALTSALTENKNLLEGFLKNGVPTSTTYETVKAKNLGEALKNLKTNVGNTKAGMKISNLLKTKKGKIGAGIGGGLLLSQLMKGKNSNNDLSDEELNELYNYVYGGQ